LEGRFSFSRTTGMRRLWVVIPVAGLLGTGIYLHARSAPDVKTPLLFEVKKSDLIIKLTELGELRALDSVTILAQKDGPISYLVPEGTTARPGDVLVRFDPTQYKVALTASRVDLQGAEAEFRMAEKDLEAQTLKLAAEIARLDAEVRLAQVELDDQKRKPLPEDLEKARLELEKAKAAHDVAEKKRGVLPELVEKGFITRSTLDEAEVNYLAGKVNLQVAQSTFEKVLAGAKPEELEKATIKLRQARFAFEKAQSGARPQEQAFEAAIERQKSNVERAKNLIEKAASELAKTELRAPQAGLVIYAKAKEESSAERVHLGMMVFAGQPLIYLPNISTMVVDTEVNEIDIGKMKKGGPVEIKLEAYSGALFHGRVFEIATVGRLKRARSGVESKIKVFDVTVQIDEKDSRLKPGLTATVDFIADRQQDVLTIPLSAVTTRGERQSVYVAKGGRFEERHVVLGPSNEQYVAVREGLREGERVMLGPPASGSR